MGLYVITTPLVGYKKRLKLENQKQKEVLKAKEKALKNSRKKPGKYTRKVI